MDVEGILAILLIFGGSAPSSALAFSPIGRAIADRLKHGKVPVVAPGAEGDPEIYNELDRLRADVSELQERVDFAERLLASPADPKPGLPT